MTNVEGVVIAVLGALSANWSTVRDPLTRFAFNVERTYLDRRCIYHVYFTYIFSLVILHGTD